MTFDFEFNFTERMIYVLVAVAVGSILIWHWIDVAWGQTCFANKKLADNYNKTFGDLHEYQIPCPEENLTLPEDESGK